MYYYLDENKKVHPFIGSLEDASDLFDEKSRRVDRTSLFNDTIDVSTVFLVIDHGFGLSAPLLFETMIFNKDGDEAGQWRYGTWDEAVAGHAKAVQNARVIFCPEGILGTFETDEI